MKRILILTAAMSALTIGAVSYAAEGGKHSAEHRAERLDRMFEKLDANGDGAIDKAEVEAGRTARFSAADANSDGVLTTDELSAAAAKRAEKHIERMMSRLDKDGDGSLSDAEYAAAGDGRDSKRGAKMFKRFDADGDGRVTRAEAEAHMAKHNKRGHNDG